jgi:hypothetical protein
MPNCTSLSRISLTFSSEPAELMADRPIFWVGCSLTFTSVEMATPTG